MGTNKFSKARMRQKEKLNTKRCREKKVDSQISGKVSGIIGEGSNKVSRKQIRAQQEQELNLLVSEIEWTFGKDGGGSFTTPDEVRIAVDDDRSGHLSQGVGKNNVKPKPKEEQSAWKIAKKGKEVALEPEVSKMVKATRDGAAGGPSTEDTKKESRPSNYQKTSQVSRAKALGNGTRAGVDLNVKDTREVVHRLAHSEMPNKNAEKVDVEKGPSSLDGFDKSMIGDPGPNTN
ncbi:OLC1v1008290C1, partial [Oldenlandia corymbosa var. corymbosa]